MGNKRLYRKLLLDFGANYGGAAEELMSESNAMAPFCNRIVRLAEDFDFDGIKKFVLDLDH